MSKLNEEGAEVTNDMATKLMLMCARDEVVDAIHAISKLQKLYSPPNPIDTIYNDENKKSVKIKTAEIIHSVDIQACSKSLNIIMESVSNSMEELFKIKYNNILISVDMLKDTAIMYSGIKAVQSQIMSVEKATLKMLTNCGFCRICGEDHQKDVWCKPESFQTMTCTKCNNERITTNRSKDYVVNAKCNECGVVGEWYFANTTLESITKIWPGYGKGAMSDCIPSKPSENGTSNIDAPDPFER